MLLKTDFYCIYQYIDEFKKIIQLKLLIIWWFYIYLYSFFKSKFLGAGSGQYIKKKHCTRTLWKVFSFYVKNIQMKNTHFKLWPRRIWISLYTDYRYLVVECMPIKFRKFLFSKTKFQGLIWLWRRNVNLIYVQVYCN